MNKSQEKKFDNDFEEDNVNLNRILTKFLDKWHWFLISVVSCLVVAFFYIQYTQPIYQVGARLLINDNQKSGSLAKQSSGLMDFGGLIGGKSSVDNEAEVLKTRFLMEQVVRDMKLNISYLTKQNFVEREIYYPPFKFEIIKGIDTLKNTEILIENMDTSRLKIVSNSKEIEIKWGQQFDLAGVGTVKFIPNAGILKTLKEKYTVKITSFDECVISMLQRLSVGVSNKQVTIIDLGFSNPLQKKGEDILNTLISRYINSNIEDKNTIADSTTKFIQKRLSIIAGELGDVENKVQSFKQGNRLADMSEQGKLLVQNSSELNMELAKAETQVSVLSDLESYLKDESKNKRVFPASLLPQDMVFSGLMSQYNSLLIERDKQLLSVTEESPFIQNIDSQISGLRAGILSNIQSTKNTYLVTRDNLKTQLNRAEGQISDVPKVEKDYLQLARNQQIKQELYIFLMQKAEETAISKTSNISIAKIIDPPKAGINPVSPRTSFLYMAGLALGLLIPAIIIISKNVLNTTVSTQEDIKNATTVPIIGEISHNDSSDNLIVANQGRSAISEQFRALRTNLSFYLKNADQKVILLTSSMSGEGKSFTAINLGNILALAGKKVLLMELDLRKPGLSAKLGISNDLGFSNYTIDSNIKLNNIIKPLSINSNMFIISSGPLPPNPAETIMSEHTPILISELKKQFDYILMDAPPIGVITDAQLLAQYADVTVYLVRQKVTHKNQLSIVQDLHRTGKMKNLGIVVNDIVNKVYGYGYGYGSYGENEKKSTFKGFFNK